MKKEFCPYCMTPVEPGKPCEACRLTEGSYTPQPHHLPPGTVLNDRYLVGRVLGEGGFGITYIGCDTRLELKVAIKEYFPTGRANRDAKTSLEVRGYTGIPGNSYENGKLRFLKEARAMARMNKLPEIVGVRDFFETNGTAYIVMEYIDGTTFKTLAAQRGGRIPAGELLRIIEPLFSALQQMHDAHLIHRDISPDNLMLENGNVRLLDFGCARESSSGNETMTVQLKHGYAPIEQYMYHGQGPWTDVYALCATMYFCLTGSAPPRSLDRLMADDLILPRKLGVDLTEQQENALLKGLAIKQGQRFRSVRELYAALYAPEPVPGPEDTGDDEGVKDGGDDPQDPKTQEQEPVEIREPIEETGERIEEPADEPKKKPWIAIGIGSALTLMAVIGLVVGLTGKPKEIPVDPGPVVQTEPAEEVDLGDNVVYLENCSEQQLRDALDSDATAVVIRSGSGVDLSDPLTLSKPLVVEEGAWMNRCSLVEVTATGCLDVRGNLNIDGLLRIRRGGQVRSSNEFHVSNIWAESPDGLLLGEGVDVDSCCGTYTRENLADCPAYLVFDPETLFANPYRVTREEQLRSIPETAASIVIEADLTLTPDTRYFDRPLMIAPGVTLISPENDDAQLCMDSTILYNCGRITGNVVLGQWNRSSAGYLVNEGNIGGWIMPEPNWGILNEGTIRSYGDWNGLTLVNLGTIDGTDYLHLNCSVTNLGTMQTDRYIDFKTGTMNAGTVRASGAERWITICDEFWGPGRMEATQGGGIWNLGNICLYSRGDGLGSGSLTVDDQSFYDDRGTLIAGPHAEVEMPNKENLRHLIPFEHGDWPENYQIANSAEELRRLMEDPQCAGIFVDSIFTVDGDLTVTKGLVIANHARLTLNNCKSLTVEGANAFIYADGTIELCGADLILRGRANMVCRKLNDLGSLTVTEESCLTVLEWEPLTTRGDITVDETSDLYIPQLTVENRALTVGPDSRIRCKGKLELTDASVTIQRGGELYSLSQLWLHENSTLENWGYWYMGGGGDRRLNGTATNYGLLRMEAWEGHIQVNGALVNSGTLEYEGNRSLHGSGAIRNQKTFRSNIAGVLDEFGGTYTGAKPIVSK